MNYEKATNDELRATAAACQVELSRRHREATEATEQRLAGALRKMDKFEPAELIYAARERCSCGCGMAYPKDVGVQGAWYCSAILLGQAEAGTAHSSPLPFMFYEVKSEQQPSVRGATTRPL